MNQTNTVPLSKGDNDDRVGGPRPGRPGFRTSGRRRMCRYCADTNAKVSYSDVPTLRLFITERGKIVPRRISGNCALHQRAISKAIKQARVLSLLPFTVMHSA